MPEEKVGFGFEFGIKGDKEVKRGLEDIIRLMGSAGNAASGIAGVLSRAGGLLEFGKMSGVIALAATAMATFAYKSAEAGENLRKTRYQIDLLSKVPVGALTDSDLAGNESAIIAQFANLGLEAGNTFNLSFADRLNNFGRGAYAVNWDVQASIANLFGLKIPSAEQLSPEAVDARNRVSQDNKIATDRINQAEHTQQALAAIRRKTAADLRELYSLNYGARPGDVGGGVMPESFVGRQRQMDIQRASNTLSTEASQKQSDFLKQQLQALVNAPIPLIPGTRPEDNMLDTAKRAQDKKNLEAEITAEMDKQNQFAQSTLEIDLQQRQIQREFVAAQNYGSWRAVGGGGRTPINLELFKLLGNHRIMPGMPTDVGYSIHKNVKGILDAAGITKGGAGGATDKAASTTNVFSSAVSSATAAVVNFAGALVGSKNPQSDLQEGSNLVGDAIVNSIGQIMSVFGLSKNPKDDFTKGIGKVYDMVNPPPDYLKKPSKKEFYEPSTFHSSNAHQGRLSDYRGMTASYSPFTGLISDSDPGYGPINPATGKYTDLSRHAHRSMVSLLRSHADIRRSHGDLPSRFMHPSDYASSQLYAEESQRLGILGSYRRSLPAHYDTSFHPGSMRGEDILGSMSKRVHGWNSPMAGFNGISGSIQGLDVLKSIDKNINKIGIPTLAN